MDSKKTYQYSPLSEATTLDEINDELGGRPSSKALLQSMDGICRKEAYTSQFVLLCLMTSAMVNVLLVVGFCYASFRWRGDDHKVVANGAGISPYTGLGYDTQYRFEYHNEYWASNETRADELWNNISTDGLVVALDQSYIAEHHLPPSNPFPWDQTKSLYYLKSFHLLHCLKHLRKVITDYQRTNATSLSAEHSFHCLDIYRQYTMCHADDTPMPARYSDSALGDGQILQCRSMNRLMQWTKQGDRNACFRMVDDLKPVKHTLEKYQYCEQSSPYYETMTSYFEIHGHKALFEEDIERH